AFSPSSASAPGPRRRPWRHRPRPQKGRANRGIPRCAGSPRPACCEHSSTPNRRHRSMETRIDEIAPDIFRLSTYVPDVAPPAGFTFNQFLVRGEQPFLFHTGMRQLFPLVSDAVDKLVGIERLRWISFAHVEADECGSMNQFLAAAPDAQVAH